MCHARRGSFPALEDLDRPAQIVSFNDPHESGRLSAIALKVPDRFSQPGRLSDFWVAGGVARASARWYVYINRTGVKTSFRMYIQDRERINH